MRKSIILGTLLVAGCMVAPPAMGPLPPEAQARLDAELAGRTAAGPPRDCVRQQELRGHRSPAPGVIVWDGAGDTIYVNRAPNCPQLRPHMALRTRTTGTNLCAGDLAVVFDPVSGIETGACALGRFQAYSR
jgi:hypothetical protein